MPLARSALAEDMGELPAAEVVRLGGEMKDTALVPVRILNALGRHRQGLFEDDSKSTSA